MTKFASIHTYLTLFTLVFCCHLSEVEGTAQRNFAADVSFVVVDFKYNAEQGVKVCEVQQAVISKFNGLTYVTGSNDTVGKKLFQVLSPYQNEIWMKKSEIDFQAYKRFGEKYGWTVHADVNEFRADPQFLERAHIPPQNPHSLLDYQGIAYFKCLHARASKEFRRKYPGILMMDGAAAGPCRNKDSMSCYFNRNPQLAQYKPKWKRYKRKYSPNLAERIIRNIGSEMFVIKPINEVKGRGVIIVHRDDLEATLYCILKQKKKALKHPDPAFKFWSVTQTPTFIVEAFVPSDPVILAHISDQPYDPTCRYIVLLSYHEQEIHVDFIESFIKVPAFSLEEEGSLNERHKSCGKFPHYDRIPSDWQEDIEAQLTDALTRLYAEMLEIN